MKKKSIIILFLLFGKISYSQIVSFDVKDNLKLYAITFNEIEKKMILEKELPKTFVVNGSMLSYISEFLGKNSTSLSVKKYVTENGWGFINDIDTLNSLRKFKKIHIKQLKPFINNFTIKNKLNFNYSLSPVIFSPDNKKAFLICQKNSSTEVYEVEVYFFIKQSDKWILIKTIVPYII